MKKKIIILSTFIICISSLSNAINYKKTNVKETNKILTRENVKLNSKNYLDISIKDVISTENINFRGCGVEFWYDFFSSSVKKKIHINYDAWINYFYPMMQKLDEYIIKVKLDTNSAGQIKIGLINMFTEVIKDKFHIGGNDTDRTEWWDGYQIAASYIIRNKEYLATFFRSHKSSDVFKTQYWDNNCFFDKEQMEALNIESRNDASISAIKKFSLPGWFPILKNEIWDIDQFFNQGEPNEGIILEEFDDRIIIEFKFDDKTIENLKRSLDKYSSLDRISYYSGNIALSFCTMLKTRILDDFKLDPTAILYFTTYLYYFRHEIDSWNKKTFAHIKKDFYWFDSNMENAYEKHGSSFEYFNVLKEWPI